MRPVGPKAKREPVPCSAGGRGGFTAASAILLLGFSYATAANGTALGNAPTGSGSEIATPFIWLPSPGQPQNRVSDDLVLALRARHALLQDEVLAGQTVGVTVRNRVAILWGAVSSTSIALRAENCIRNLPGLIAIRSELAIDPSARSPHDPALPGSKVPLPPSRQVQAELAHRRSEQASPPGQEFRWRPAGGKGPDQIPAQSRDDPLGSERLAEKSGAESLPGFPSPDSTWVPRLSTSPSVIPAPLRNENTALLLPALVLPARPAVADPARPSVNFQPASSQTTPRLVRRIEALRLADDRFYRLRAQVRGDVVYLRGTVYCWDQLFELAESIARLPGVRRVLFEDVQAESP
jgi:osmotically-inducible protein OsmY